MKKTSIRYGVFLVLTLSLIAACSKTNDLMTQTVQDQSSGSLSPLRDSRSLQVIDSAIGKVSVFASGIAYPRGLKFGPDGNLYVALAGFGGTDLTTGKCEQVIPPVGPYKGGHTASIVKINSHGSVSIVADKLPSDINAEGFTGGVSDVEFVGDDLYALLVAGCSHGNGDYPSSVIKVNRRSGTWKVVADLSTYFLTHPVAQPEEDDFEPDGTPYSMLFVDGNFYVIEPNHGELLKVTRGGDVTRVLDFSDVYGHIVPTVEAFNHGSFYISNLRTFPLVGGSSSVYKVSRSGSVDVFATGFTGVLGIAFDKKDRLYILETSAGGGPIPQTGRVVRINKDNSRDLIAGNLMFPTGMTFGPDGALYISDTGFGPPTGKIVKVELKNNDDGHNDNDHHDNDHHDNDHHDNDHHDNDHNQNNKHHT